MAFGGDRHRRAAKGGQGGDTTRVGQGGGSVDFQFGPFDRRVGAAGDDADGDVAGLLRCRLRRGDERKVLATPGQQCHERENEESEPERAAGQQGQVLSAGGSISSSARARAAARRAATVGARSPAVLYRALPTTSTSPPLASATPIVSRFTPPSTPICSPRSRRLISSRRTRSFGTTSWMNDCPPHPGWTVMTSSRSTWSSHGSTASAGVWGLSAIPGRLPARSISAMTARGSSSASTWKTIRSLPACAKRSAYASGRLIIRWLWNGSALCGRTASTATGPNVRLSTKWPSMTSRWIESTPPAVARSTSSPSRPKSALRMLALRCGAALMRSRRSRVPRAPRAATGRRAGRGAVRTPPRSRGRACRAR